MKSVNLCVDLTTHLQKDRLPKPGKSYRGTLLVKGRYNYGFVEDGPKRREKRNPIIYYGYSFNLHCTEKGYVYPTFIKPELTPSYTLTDFLRESAEELRFIADHIDRNSNNSLVEK